MSILLKSKLIFYNNIIISTNTRRVQLNTRACRLICVFTGVAEYAIETPELLLDDLSY